MSETDPLPPLVVGPLLDIGFDDDARRAFFAMRNQGAIGADDQHKMMLAFVHRLRAGLSRPECKRLADLVEQQIWWGAKPGPEKKGVDKRLELFCLARLFQITGGKLPDGRKINQEAAAEMLAAWLQTNQPPGQRGFTASQILGLTTKISPAMRGFLKSLSEDQARRLLLSRVD